jgi:tRNA nucleotidyltransferase (CCA-adding enzyme)
MPFQARWETFAHGADIGVRGIGPTRAAAFAEAARALTGVITDPEKVRHTQRVAVACEAPDDELLLADWLNAMVFEMATRGLLFGDFEVRIEDHRLEGVLWGEPVDLARHAPAVEVKGATYTALRVERQDDGSWLAQCVVDV